MLVEEKHNQSISTKGVLTKERREKLRTKEVAAIPWWYVPWAHLAGTTSLGLLIFTISLIQLIKLSNVNNIIQWFIIVPSVIVFANFIEWNVHKHLQHHRRRPLHMLYDTHTPVHHMIYVENDMAYHSTKEFNLILMPSIGIIGILLFSITNSLILSFLWSPSAGWLFMLVTSFYVITAEFLHLCYHLPNNSFFTRFKFIRMMHDHHAKHHDPKLMRKFNFNITFPLFDYIMGTIATKDNDANSRTKK